MDIWTSAAMVLQGEMGHLPDGRPGPAVWLRPAWLPGDHRFRNRHRAVCPKRTGSRVEEPHDDGRCRVGPDNLRVCSPWRSAGTGSLHASGPLTSARAAAALINTLDPDMVVLGGGVAESGLLMDEMKRVAERRLHSPAV